MVTEGQAIEAGRIARRVLPAEFDTNGDVLYTAFYCQSGKDKDGNPISDTELSITFWEGLAETQDESDEYTNDYPTRSGAFPGLCIFDAVLIPRIVYKCGTVACLLGNPADDGKRHDDRHCRIPGCPQKASAKTFAQEVLKGAGNTAIFAARSPGMITSLGAFVV